jgi:DNA-binding transcriptional LysR family regulator
MIALPRLDLDLEALRVLVLIADLGSISAAARAERISQPAASKRIKVLESRLRLELLDRRSHGAVLTAHGRMVTEWSRRVVEAADALLTGASTLSEQATSKIRIGASQTVAEYLMPRWLAEFRQRTPGTPVHFLVGSSAMVIDAVRGREIDLGFVETPQVPTDLSSQPVAHDRLVLVVGPAHRLARRRIPLPAGELAQLPLVTRQQGSGTRETLELAVGAPMADPALELETNAAVKIAAAAGELGAVLSELVVSQELRDGRLVEVPLADIDLTRRWHAIWRGDTQWRGALADFRTLVADWSGSPQPLTPPS